MNKWWTRLCHRILKQFWSWWKSSPIKVHLRPTPKLPKKKTTNSFCAGSSTIPDSSISCLACRYKSCQPSILQVSLCPAQQCGSYLQISQAHINSAPFSFKKSSLVAQQSRAYKTVISKWSIPSISSAQLVWKQVIFPVWCLESLPSNLPETWVHLSGHPWQRRESRTKMTLSFWCNQTSVLGLVQQVFALCDLGKATKNNRLAINAWIGRLGFQPNHRSRVSQVPVQAKQIGLTSNPDCDPEQNQAPLRI